MFPPEIFSLQFWFTCSSRFQLYFEISSHFLPVFHVCLCDDLYRNASYCLYFVANLLSPLTLFFVCLLLCMTCMFTFIIKRRFQHFHVSLTSLLHQNNSPTINYNERVTCQFSVACNNYYYYLYKTRADHLKELLLYLLLLLHYIL